MFDFPQSGVGNSVALCEVVRSLRPKTAPFFADPWQQICGNDIVSCWVITHNSVCHILQSPGMKWRVEKKRITLKYWRKMTGEMSSTWSAILKKFTPTGHCSGNNCFILHFSDWCVTEYNGHCYVAEEKGGFQMLMPISSSQFFLYCHFHDNYWRFQFNA